VNEPCLTAQCGATGVGHAKPSLVQTNAGIAW